MAKRFMIITPRGKIYHDQHMRVQLEWNPDFKDKWEKRYTNAQKFVDSEVLRLCEPYTPLLTGMLIKSGTLGTIPGRGYVEWIAPYAKYQYYLKRKTPSTTGPLRGSAWFQRMKEVHGSQILSGARRFAGGERA